MKTVLTGAVLVALAIVVVVAAVVSLIGEGMEAILEALNGALE